MKKLLMLLSVILAIVIIVPSVSFAFTIENHNTVAEFDKRIEKTKEVANNLLTSLDKNSNLNNLTLLKNLNGDIEAVLFSLDKTGYIIVNINDFTVPEFSLERKNPFNNVKNPIYNGPLNYYSKKDLNTALNIKDSTIIEKHNFANIYANKKINLEELNLFTYKNSNNDVVPYGNLNTIKKLPGTLKTWYIDGNNCGSIASAITMRYYYDYIDKNYVSSSKI
ncbi:hypothetical protein [uncultured Helcococcus sp.]|nr:hypothetical protein [uncultured Helcococcus sp.]